MVLPPKISRAAAQAGQEDDARRSVSRSPRREGHPATSTNRLQAIRKSKKDAVGKSTTNKEKARKKNMMMITMGKAKRKNKRSLVETKKTLKAHIARSKKRWQEKEWNVRSRGPTPYRQMKRIRQLARFKSLLYPYSLIIFESQI